nr:MAG TPA: hypothetical protein [Microviridae sp.]
MDAIKIKLLRDILRMLDQIYHVFDKMADSYLDNKKG